MSPVSEKGTLALSLRIDAKIRDLLKDNKPFIGSRNRRPKELSDSVATLLHLKYLCIYTRNFTFTSLRRVLRRNSSIPDSVVYAFVNSWVKLKMTQTVFPELREICYIILRNFHTIQFQLDYISLLEDYPQSSNFINKRLKESYFINNPPMRRIAELYLNIPMELWVTDKVLPRIYYRKESKLEYSFIPYELSDDTLHLYRQRCKMLIKYIGLQKLFVPPRGKSVVADLHRYNDGGVVRRDWERPKISTTCGFMLQTFNTGPMVTREVWLPDYQTKVNNSFWMIIARQFLQNVSWYPKEHAEDTFESIKERIRESFLLYFDISAFGLQYIRELMVIFAEEIHEYYPDPNLSEELVVLKAICSKVTLQTPEKFVYPSRGIGLGYYEDLKTLGVAAILFPWMSQVVSLYGDQALISTKNVSFKKSKEPVEELRRFGFIIKDDKLDTKFGVVKWSGWTMMATRNKEVLAKRCRVSSAFCTIFDGEYHWERKNRIVGFYTNFPEYKKKMVEFPLIYEKLYGHEFCHGDSLNSHSQCGVAPHSTMQVGHTRFYKVQYLNTPKDIIKDNLVYSSPFIKEWERTTSRNFSKYRKRIFLSTRGDSSIFEYLNPIIRLNKTVQPILSPLQRVVSEKEDLHMIAMYGLTVGRYTFGLSESVGNKALLTCSFASNPFEAYATGGYSVITNWHHPRRVSAEWYYVFKYLINGALRLDAGFASYYSEEQRRKDIFDSDQFRKRVANFPSWGTKPKKLMSEENFKNKNISVRLSLEEFNTEEGNQSNPLLDISTADNLLSNLLEIEEIENQGQEDEDHEYFDDPLEEFDDLDDYNV